MRAPLGCLKIPDLCLASTLVRSTVLRQWHMLPSSVSEEYDHAGSSECYPTPNKRLPWNKGHDTGSNVSRVWRAYTALKQSLQKTKTIDKTERNTKRFATYLN